MIKKDIIKKLPRPDYFQGILQLRDVNEDVLNFVRNKYDFQQMLAQLFSRNELKEMDGFLHEQDKLSVHPLMRMIQHTSTIYVPDEIRSYAHKQK